MPPTTHPRATVTLELMDDAAALVTDWRNSSGAHVTPSQSGVLRAMVAAALADAQAAERAACRCPDLNPHEHHPVDDQ